MYIQINVIILKCNIMEKQSNLLRKKREFPVGSGVRTLHAHCLGPRFDPSSRNQDPISHVGQQPATPHKKSMY